MKKFVIMSIAIALSAAPALAGNNGAMNALQTLQSLGMAPATPAPATVPVPAQPLTRAAAMEQLKNYALSSAGASAAANAGIPATATAASTGSVIGQLKSAATAGAAMYVVDSNHDGQVSKAEMNALDNKMFDLADTDHNGQLSQAELQTLSTNVTRVMALLK